MSKLKATYKGSGFHHGIPARDLTEEDWARLTAEQKKLVELSSMYVMVEAGSRANQKATKQKEGD